MDEKGQPVKLTVTFQDGTAESHEVFIAVAAKGLIIAGKKDGRIYYTADAEHFAVSAICSIAADSVVVAALLEGVTEVIGSIIESASDNPSAILELLRVLRTTGQRKTTLYEDKQIIRKKPEQN